MKIYPFCQPYFWENPKVLLSTGFTWKAPKEGPCVSEIVNHIVLVYSVAVMVGALAVVALGSSFAMTISIGIATLFSLPSFWALITLRSQCEGFADAEGPIGATSAAVESLPSQPVVTTTGAAPMYDVIGSGASAATLTLPTARNPFMNVLLDEIKYNPTRPLAIKTTDPSVKVSLDDFFRTEFYNDPTDVFGKTQSQREFITMPSTGIPNDQASYQDWLYKIPGKTCKEGGREACLPGTDGGALPWMNVNP